MLHRHNIITIYEDITGDTPNITEWMNLEFYDLVWWINQINKYDVNEDTQQFSIWLGVSHIVGSDL